MSADLFAAFNSSFQSPAQQQSPQTISAGSQASGSKGDPFPTLTPSAAQSQQQQHRQSTQWKPYHSQQPDQKPQPWFMSQPQTAPVILGTSSDLAGSSSVSDAKGDDDDGWGDFEDALQSTSTATIPPGPASALGSPPAQPNVLAQVPFRTRMVRASTIDLMTNSLVPIGGPASKPAAPRDGPFGEAPEKPQVPRPKSSDPNVLFDADDFDGEPLEDDDEFGDFETVPPPVPINVPTEQPVVDLLSTDFTPQRTETRKPPPSQLLSTLTPIEGLSPYPTAPRSPSFQARNPFPSLGVTTPKAAEFSAGEKPPSSSPVTAWPSPSPVTAWPSFDEDDGSRGPGQNNGAEDWGTFQDLPSKPAEPRTTNKSATSAQTSKDAKPASDWNWDAWDGDATHSGKQPTPAETPAKPEAGPPPVNVPPPSILLSLFPQLLGSATTYLFKPTSGQPGPIKDRVLSDPATVRFLRGYLSLAAVAGRIMAGRKLRWQRDKFLSQGMAISAAAGGKRGMKLSGVDRSQASHEDREAADVAAAWGPIVGRLRSAVAAANSALGPGEPRLGAIPELADGLVVRTAKGALTAPKPCVICGLKRDERVGKVDFEVEDSFGEWWVEFWGHRSCRNFWLEHEVQLRQR